MIEKNSIENGTIVGCDIQTDGIGTHGRKWFSTIGNLTFSFYFEPNKNLTELENISIEIANIIKAVFDEIFNRQIDIIYPNDLYINGKKFGGILVESVVSNDIVKNLVIGVGLNNSTSRLDGSIENIATSYFEEYGECFDENIFLNRFFEKFEEKYL